MASSTESKLKSKYESSSRKIQELYQQFSTMRRQLCTPTKRNRNEDSFLYSGDKFDKQSFKNSIEIIVPKSNPRQSTKVDSNMTLNFQIQTFLRNAIMKNFTNSLTQLDKKLDQRISLMQHRLQQLTKLFYQICKLNKIKVTNLKSKTAVTCKCSQVKTLLKQVEQKYQKKISEMVSGYETKISLLVKQHQETEDSATFKQIPKQFKDELQKIEDKLIVKDQEITSLKLESSKLRRSLDQHKSLVNQKQELIHELTNEIKEKEVKLQQIQKQRVDHKGVRKEKCIECPQLQEKILRLQSQLQSVNKQKRQLQITVTGEKSSIREKKAQSSINLMPSSREDDRWGSSWIQNQQIATSENGEDFFEEESQKISSTIKISNIDDCQPLRHTQYFDPGRKKGAIKYQQRIKELESQNQLLAEQNYLLKNKKDKFEEQVKQNENDEMKFQMQNQIMRDQLKLLNTNIKILDQCAILYLREKKVGEEQVEKLGENIKFKQEYFKKFPRKKQQRSVSKG